MPMHTIPTPNDAEAHWGIVYYSNWYRVSRLVHTDGKWFELYWHPELKLRGKNREKVKKQALDSDLHLLHGVFCDAPAPRNGNVMQWSIKP